MSENLPTRQTLLERLKKLKDNHSWEDFVLYYKGYIFAVIHGMGLNNLDAEDLSQKVLLKLWKNLPEYEYRPGNCKFRTWLCTVIRSEVYSWYRSQQSQKKKLENFQINLTDEEGCLPEIEKIAQQEWKEHIGKLAWDNVKKAFSQNVIDAFLMYSEGKSTKEIAEVLQMEENTVNVYKKRVREKLCKEINLLDDDLG